VYTPLPALATVGVALFAPETVTLRRLASLLPLRTFPLASRTVMLSVVGEPAVPAGTLTVVCAALAAPGLTALVNGLPLIPVPLNVIATLSVPTAVGV